MQYFVRVPSRPIPTHPRRIPDSPRLKQTEPRLTPTSKSGRVGKPSRHSVTGVLPDYIQKLQATIYAVKSCTNCYGRQLMSTTNYAVTARDGKYMCRRTEVGLTFGLPRHRHSVEVFHVSVFFGYSEKPPHFSRLLRHAYGYGLPILVLPWGVYRLV